MVDILVILLILIVLGVQCYLAIQIAHLRGEVKNTWEFTYRRGKSELLQKGWADFQSPFTIKAESFEKVLPFLTKFLPFYAHLVSLNLSEPEMAAQFEREFGDFIMEKICFPQGLSEAGCLVAIIEACKIGSETHG